MRGLCNPTEPVRRKLAQHERKTVPRGRLETRAIYNPTHSAGSGHTASLRKLTTILSADVFGYSRLMADDDRATLDTLKRYRRVISERVSAQGGRVIDAPGDALLAEFASVVEAVTCASAIQRLLKQHNEELPAHRRMLFRFGINLGDVIEEDGALYGELGEPEKARLHWQECMKLDPKWSTARMVEHLRL